MTAWNVIVLISLVIVVGLCIYNIVRLIQKIKHNPSSTIDLLMGVAIFSAGIAALVYVFIRVLQIAEVIPM